MVLRKIVPLFFLCYTAITPVYAADGSAPVQQWLHLRDSREYYDFLTYTRFLNNHPGWPQENAIRLNAEASLLRDGADTGTIADWFTSHPPLTDEGRLRYILALQQTGRDLPAKQIAREYWHAGYFDTGRQARLFVAIPGFLSQADHIARLDTLLWNGNLSRAETLLSQVGPEQRAIAQARMALQRSSSKAASLVAAVSGNRRNTDNGLMFDRVRFARVRGDDDFALQLMNQFSGKYGTHDSQWWRERHILARRLFEKGNFKSAYNLAAHHNCTKDADYAEAEWFAGWIALTRLHQPKAGFDHFERMYRRVATPLSKARAAYWTGTAAEELGQPAVANAWFKAGEKHPHVFYGLMSAYALNNPKQAIASFMQRNQTVSQGAIATLPSDMVQAARTLDKMGKTKERDMFLNALIAQAKEKGNPQAVIPLAKELHSPPSILLAGKAAYEKNILVVDALFPRISVNTVEGVDPALTLAIMRQESLFDRYATSSAQARGLMQLLDGTAAHVAKRYSVSYSGSQSLYDPATNTRLGQLYLKDLLARYDGFAPLSIAAYNAGQIGRAHV